MRRRSVEVARFEVRLRRVTTMTGVALIVGVDPHAPECVSAWKDPVSASPRT